MAFQPVNADRIAIASQRRAAGTIHIYHSCDPPGTALLHHYKKGKYTPFNGFDADYPTEHVHVPRRYGNQEVVLRCARHTQGCLECVLTEYEATDLSLCVAKAHGIRGAYIRPTPAAKTVEERRRDGEARGAWMYGEPDVEELGSQMLRWAEFHPKAEQFKRVLRWLAEIPWETDSQSSVPLIGGNLEVATARNAPPYVPGLGRRDTLVVGAEWSDPMIKVEPEHESKVRPVLQSIPQPRTTAMASSYTPGFDRRRPTPIAPYMAGIDRLREDVQWMKNKTMDLKAGGVVSTVPQQVSTLGQEGISPVGGRLGPVVATAHSVPDQRSELLGGPVARPHPIYGAPLPSVVPRMAEKRMLEEAGMMAQGARGKKARYGLEGVSYGM